MVKSFGAKTYTDTSLADSGFGEEGIQLNQRNFGTVLPNVQSNRGPTQPTGLIQFCVLGISIGTG